MLKSCIPRWSYDVVPEKCYHVDLGEYHTYGIKVTGSGYSAVLHDISVDKEVVTYMKETFNRCQLSPVHLLDVIEDMIS